MHEVTHMTAAKNLMPSPGNESFKEFIRGNCYYVDKTPYLKTIFNYRGSRLLMLRPRRFGKTLMMSTIRYFFEMNYENPGDTSLQQDLFKGLDIMKDEEFCRENMGQYPVVSLSLKDTDGLDFRNALDQLGETIFDLAYRFTWLMDSKVLQAKGKEAFSRLLDHDHLCSGNESSINTLQSSLFILCRALYEHCGKSPLLLIDEYDTPIQQGHSRNFYNEVITFMRNFMSGGLKDNPSLAFGVLTGILRVSKENLFSGLNNPIVNSVLDEKYSKYFGFTVDEVNTMAAYYGQEAKLEELREWYDGYRFGSTEIYNPWSVANYFYNNCQAKPYWTNTSDNEIIREIMISLTPDIAENLFALLQGQTVQASLNMDVIYPRITDGTDTIFSFLLLAGYLKPVSDAVETEFGTFMELALPNKEIRRVYNTEILSWLRVTVDGNVMAGLEKALYLNDGKKLQEFLRKYMITCISCFDGAAEGFYHGMMLGLAAGMSSRYYIRSNRESGEGRFDLVLEPKVHSLPGIIMEFKATKNDAGLSASADEALKQIEDKHYDTDMKDRGIKEIVKYGIAFAGKNVEIANG